MKKLLLFVLMAGLAFAQEIEVGAIVVGKVAKVHVREGQRVKKGQLILEIDPALYLAELKKLKGRRKELEARLWKVERDYNRLKELFERDLLAETRFEDQKIRYDTLKAQLQQVEGDIERVETLISYTKVYAPVSGRVIMLLVREGSYVNGRLQPQVLVLIRELK
ncbi:efflux RND transporter periplasmic adaptor subunit [Hydrogenivirga sp.]